MDLKQKLKLSQQTDCIYLFREGVFVHVYLKSLYILITQLGFTLSINAIKQKKRGGFILRAGIPCQTIEKRFPALVKTEYGYYLKGNWNCDDYHHWYTQQYQILIQKTAKQLTSTSNQFFMPLSSEQQSYLLNWAKPQAELTSEAQFILELKQTLINHQRGC